MGESACYVAPQSIPHGKRLSRLPRYPPLSISDVRQGAVCLPRVQGAPSNELPRGEQVVVLGGHDLWRLECDGGKSGIDDAVWRPTPRNLWGLIFATCFSESESNDRFSVCHSPTHALEEMTRQATGREKYRLLMSVLSKSTQKQYSRFRCVG